MAIIKCKMCGGELNIVDASFVAECEYCGTKQTIPSLDDDKKIKMFERANKLRATCEFDKASGIYESIVEDYPEEAEAYWGLILCKYGIEYVDDPATGNKIPTCHRSSFDSVMDDPNFELVMENADSIAVDVYRNEAKQIEEIRKGIIQVSNQEQPYDVFICYKETDEYGERTVDSVIAQDVYKELTREGYRVFFSRITLEDKLGQEYEPYIFAALNSAKVMLAFGTDYKYYNAVWVKNEWSRYLKLIAAGQKKTLIPCYKGIDAYDMPKEFARLQAQDMGKVGATQDLLRGLEKIFGRDAKPQAESTVKGGINENTYITRGMMCLEEKSWDKAIEYFEQAMNINEGSADAYLGLYFAEKQFENLDDINAYAQEKLDSVKPEMRKVNLDKKQREWNVYVGEKEIPGYLDGKDISPLFSCATDYKTYSRQYKNVETEIRELIDNKVLNKALGLMNDHKRQEFDEKINDLFGGISERISIAETDEIMAEKTVVDKIEIDLSAAKKKAEQLYEEASSRREDDYKKYCEEKERYIQSKEYDRLLQVAERFKKLGKYKDSDKTAEFCINLVNSKRKAAKKKKVAIIGSVAAVVIIVVVAVVVLMKTKILPEKKYNEAMALIESGNYEEGYVLLRELGDYKGAEEIIGKTEYDRAIKMNEEGKYEDGLEVLQTYGDEEMIKEYQYTCGCKYLEQQEYRLAYKALEEIYDYKDSKELVEGSKYNRALELMKNLKYADAIALLDDIPEYLDSKELIKEANYLHAEKFEVSAANSSYIGDDYEAYYNAALLYEKADDYLDANKKVTEIKYAFLKELYYEKADVISSNGYASLEKEIYDYALSLKNLDYEDSKEIYDNFLSIKDKINVY